MAAKQWSEVAGSPDFAALPDEDKDVVREAYFERVVEPEVAPDQISATRERFDRVSGYRKRSLPADVKPSTAGAGRGMSTPAGPRRGTMGRVAPFVGGDARLVEPIEPGGSVLDRPYNDAQSPIMSEAEYGQLEAMSRRPEPERPASMGGEIKNSPPEVVAGTMIRKATGSSGAGAAVQGMASGFGGLGKAIPGLVAGAADAVGAEGVSEFALGAAKRAEGFSKAVQPQGGYVNKLIGGVFASTVESLPTLAFGLSGATEIVAGKVVADVVAKKAASNAMRELFVQTAGQEYADARNAGFKPLESASRAAIFGAAEVLGERFGFHEQMAVIKAAVGKTAVPTKDLGNVLVTEMLKQVPGEELTTAVEFLADKYGPAAMNPKATFQDYLQQAADTAVQTMGQTALMGAPASARSTYAKADAAIAYTAAREKGFHVDPPLTTDTADKQRKKTVGIFQGLAAQVGMSAEAAKAAVTASVGKPLSQLGGFFRRFAEAADTRGLTGERIEPHIADTLTAGPIEPPDETKPAKPETKAPESAVVASGGATTAQDAAVDKVASLLGRPAVTIDDAAHEAAPSPTNDRPEPTPAQIDAGNYKLGHDRIGGLDVSIENDEGSVRRSKPGSPVTWETTVTGAHYGYIRGTVSADKEHVDTFIKPGTPRDFGGSVFVVDQNHEDGSFDESKVMLGFGSEAEARAAYLSNYQKGWKGLRSVTPMTMDGFKAWVYDPAKTTKPAAGDDGGSKTRPPGARLMQASAVPDVAEREGQVPQPQEPVLPQLRGAGDQAAQGVGGQLPGVSGRGGREADAAPHAGAAGNQRALPVGQRKLGDQTPASQQPAQEPDSDRGGRATTDRGNVGEGTRGGSVSPLLAAQDSERGRGADDAPSDSPQAVDRATPVKAPTPAPTPAAAPIAAPVAGEGPAQRVIAQVGSTPTNATPLTLTTNPDGSHTAWLENREVIDFDSGKPVIIPAGATNKEVLDAIKKAGSLGKRAKLFKIEKDAAAAPAPPAPPAAPTASWVIRERATGKVIMETFDRKKVDALNTAKYEAVPILEHLAGLNAKVKAEQAAAPPAAELSVPDVKAPSVADIHALADSKGVKWDNDVAFIAFTKLVTGKEHLDDLDGPQRQALLDRLGEVDELPDKVDAADNADKGYRITADGKGRFTLEGAEDTVPDKYGLAPRSFPSAKVAVKWAKDNAIVLESETPVESEPSPPRSSEMDDESAEWEHRFETLFVEPEKTVRVQEKAQAAGFISTDAADALLADWHRAAQNPKRQSANSSKTVLSLFDYTGTWSGPWIEAGYNVIQVDIKNGQDIHDISIESLADAGIDDVDIVLAACPCTDFAASGARWWQDKDGDGRTEGSIDLVRQTKAILEYFRPKTWAIENPVGRIQGLGGLNNPRLIFNPNHFGDPYTKKTLLYGNFNTELPLAHVEATEGSKIHKLSSSAKAEREITPEGFAYAFFMANGQDHGPVDAVAAPATTTPPAVSRAAAKPKLGPRVYNADGSYHNEPAEKATPDAIDGKAWWKSLTKTGRERVLAAAGIRLPALVTWDRIVPENQAKLLAEKGTELDDRERDQAASEALKARIHADVEKAGGRIIGQNTEGQDIREDARGVRSITTNGVRSTEAVAMRPTRNGMQISVEHEGEYLTAEEAKAAERIPYPDNHLPLHVKAAGRLVIDHMNGDIDKATLIQRLADMALPEGVVRSVTQRLEDFTEGDVGAVQALQPAPAAPKTWPGKHWDEITPVRRKAMLEAAGYTDADQVRVLSNTKWTELTDPVRKALAPDKKPVTPQIEGAGGPGVKYVLPSFVTGQQTKTAPQFDKAKALSDLNDALGDLGDIFAKPFKSNMLPEQEQKLLPVLIRVMDAAFRAGYYSFKDAARFVLDTIRAKIGPEVADDINLDHLQAAYIGMAGQYKDAGATSKRDVVAVESLAELTETPAPAPVVSDNAGEEDAPSDEPNGRDTGPVDNAQERGDRRVVADGVEGREGAGAALAAPPSADGGPTGAPEHPAADGARAPEPAGGRGNGLPGVGDDADGRSGAGRPGLAADGTGSGGPTRAGPARPNYHVADPETLIGGTPKVRFARNRAAIEAFNAITADGREPTAPELDSLAAYIGWGSFGQELFQGNWDNPRPKAAWEKEDAWLREHMGKEAWQSAQASIINAHYTDPITAGTMWDMVRAMGFTGGRTLEPSLGIGNFFGLMPRDLMERSALTGIELDSTTGGMAQILYPDANVQIKGYQDSKTADDFYDLVIGNWPFAKDGPPGDRRYAKLNPSLHDYFFLKALDQVRPGGIVIGITSAGTMDKKGKATRMEMAKKGELVASFRLPSGAFEKYAGTSVVTDIIVLRKRERPLADVSGEAWIELGEFHPKDGPVFGVNRYYLDHPDHVLGTLNFGSGSTYGRPSMIVDRPDNLLELLAALPGKMPADSYAPRVTSTSGVRYVSNNTSDRQGSVTLDPKGGLYVVRGDQLAALEDVAKYRVKDAKENARRDGQLKALIEIRRAYGALIDGERAGTEGVDALRTALHTQYQAFVKKHGQINGSEGLRIIRRVGDPFFATLAALEHEGKPARIFTESTVRATKRLDKPGVRDAFVAARNESIGVDIAKIAADAGVSEVQVIAELEKGDAIFRTPAGNYEVTDVYLSGNVRRKLREAQDALAAGQADMQRNIDGLNRVMPKTVPYFQIEAKLGAPWVKHQQYHQFVAELLSVQDRPTTATDIKVTFVSGSWKVRFENDALNNLPEATTRWGMPRSAIRFDKLVTAAMNNRSITIKYKDNDGNMQVDEKDTRLANERVTLLREEFSAWAWRDAERRVWLEDNYNEVMNAVATPSFDGSFLEFPGMALQRGDDPFSLRKHQVDAIWRGLANGSGLYAHEVGTGKTYTMAGIAVESRRYGLAKKPLLFAHNANSASVASEINDMYPGAKVLYIDNLAPDQIDLTMRKIANDDWDAVVVPHSLIDRFSLTKETLDAISAEEIAALEQEALDVAAEEGASLSLQDMDDPDAMKKVRSATAKQLVHSRNQIKKKIADMVIRSSREGAIAFEELGVDMVIVDEGHEFKKPPLVTKMKMKGLNTATSNKSIALRFLTDYVKGQNNGRGVHVFTGTPITNTLAEIYNQMRYVMDDQMARDGIKDWDTWFATFADSATNVEITTSGEHEAVTTLSSFVNVAELRRIAGQYMDIVFADDMPEFKPRPTASGKIASDPSLTEAERDQLMTSRSEVPIGRPYKKIVTDVAQMSPAQVVMHARIVEMHHLFKNASKRSRRDMIASGHEASPVILETKASNVGMDARMVDMDAADAPDSKVNRAVLNVKRHYDEHPQATQVIFMDRGYSDVGTRTKTHPGGTKTTTKFRKLNLAKDIVDKLEAQGIPRDQIVIVDGSMSKEARKATADAMNEGTVRVVIGLTATLGVGVNMQRNLRAMHHLDAPWMPGELEQRNGRGWRQGNKWDTVLEYRYITEGLDGRRWQVLARKARIIRAFLEADETLRIIDGDAAGMDEEGSDIEATLSEAAGDPRLLIRSKLTADVAKLETRERNHTFGVADARSKGRQLREDVAAARGVIEQWEGDAAAFAAARELPFSAKVGGKTIDKRAEFDDALLAFMQQEMAKNDTDTPLAQVYGFKISGYWPSWAGGVLLRAKSVSGGKPYDVSGSIQSIDTVLRNLSKRVADAKAKGVDALASAERMDEASKLEFQQGPALAKKKAMLADVEADLQANPTPPPAWLRNGAPVGTRVFVDGDPIEVEGHRWGANGYFIVTAEGDVPYLDVKDDNGFPIYEDKGFKVPVQSLAGMTLSDTQGRQVTVVRGPYLEGLVSRVAIKRFNADGREIKETVNADTLIVPKGMTATLRPKKAPKSTNLRQTGAPEANETDVVYADIGRGKPREQTPGFKHWFKGSKVVDAEGEPQVNYHITAKDFDEFKAGGFDPKLSGHAIWMSPDKDYQPAAHNVGGDPRRGFKEGARVMPVFVKMQRPLLIDDQTMLDWAQAAFADGSKEFPQVMPKKWVDAVTEAGYDGVLFRMWGKPETIVFSGSQIKSAIGNSGAFDETKPSLVEDIGGNRLTRLGEQMARQGYEKASVPVVQAANNLQKLIDQHTAGKLTDGEFVMRSKILADRMSEVSATKAANKLLGERVRDVDHVRAELLEARRKGELDAEGVAFALWALDKNPALAANLGISILKSGENTPQGDYNPVAEIIRLFKDGSSTDTVVHEILHHAERMMPEAMQAAIRKEWARALAKAIKNGTPEQVAALRNVPLAMAGDKAAYQALTKAIQEGPLNYAEHYPLVNPSEYWAVNGSRILGEQRHAAAGSIWQKIRQFLRELVQKARALVGLSSTAPIIRALHYVTDASHFTVERGGRFASERMLSDPKGGVESPSAMKSVEANEARGAQAMNRALLDKTTVHRAMFRNGLGWVDFEWGDTRRGIRHIIEVRAEKDAMSPTEVERLLTASVPRAIARGSESARIEVAGAVNLRIDHDGVRVVLVRKPGSNAWLLTGFELVPESEARVTARPSPSQPLPMRTRQGLGAGESILPDDGNTPLQNIRPGAATPPPRLAWRDATNRLQFAPGQWLYDALGKAAGPLLAKIGMKSMSPELRHLMRTMKLDVQKAQDIAVGVSQSMQAFSAGEREMVSDIIEQELAAGVTPPAHAVRMAALMSQTMTDQSTELVALDMLSSDAAARWDGKYLPRFYESKLRKQVGDAWTDAVKRLRGRTSVMKGVRGNHLKMRGLPKNIPVEELPDHLALGWEVRDPGYDPDTSTDVQVWRDWTREERDARGEIRDANFRFVMGYMQTQRDLALGRMFAGMAADPTQSSRLKPEGLDWVQVPRTHVEGTGINRYGKLSGRFVPREVLSHLSQIEEASSAAWTMYRKGMGLWKEGKTALNPGSHMNNVVGNVAIAHLAGVSLHRGDKYVSALKDFMWKAPMVKEARDAGLFLGSMSDAELMNSLPKDLKALVAKADSGVVKGAKLAFNIVMLRRPLGAAYGAEDTYFRYLLYKDARSRGATPEASVDFAQRYIFTYDDLPKGARMVRDFGIPFFSYTYKLIPMALHSVLTQPVRFGTLAALAWVANAAAYAIAAGDDDDDKDEWYQRLMKAVTDPAYRAKARAMQEAEQKGLPPWMRGHTAMFTAKTLRLGTDKKTQLPLFIDIARFVPGGDMNEVSPKVPGLMWLPQPLTPSHPLLTLTVGMMANTDLWTGKPLVDSNDTIGEITKKEAAWIWKLASPAIAIGNSHWERGMNAAAQASGGELTWLPDFMGDYTGIDKGGQPVQPTYAALQTFGIKVKPMDLDTSERIDKGMQNKTVREIYFEVRKLKRQNNIGAISDKQFEREREAAIKKREMLREGLTVDGNER